MIRTAIILACLALLASLWPGAALAQTAIGPVSPDPVVAFYLQGGSSADTATVTLRQGTVRSLNQILLRVYDQDENEIARWYSRQKPGDNVPAAGSILHTLEFALDGGGVYQVRISHRGGNRLTAAIGSAGQLSWGVSFQNGAFKPWAGQPATFHFFVPPRAEELTISGRHARLYNGVGALVETWPSSDTTQTVAFGPADWDTVWRAEIANLGSWQFSAAHGIPLILCSSAAFAESLRASTVACADGTWVSHRFQADIGAILDDLLGPAKRAATIGEASQLVRTLNTTAWTQDPDRNMSLVRNYSVFPFVRPALLHQFEYAGNPHWNAHWRHWGGAMGHYQKQPHGWHFWVTQPPPANRWDRWKRIVAPAGASSNNTLVSGVSPNSPDAYALAFAYVFDNAALNPYRGDERIKYRAAIAALRDLMTLTEAEIWQVSASSSYEGSMGFYVAKSMPAYALLNQHMPANIQAAWTEGVGRLCDRVYTDSLASTRNQSSHHLVSFYEMYEGSLDPMRLDMATDFAARFIEGIHPAGWAMEATGPDATYQGMTHWHMAVYYKKSGDAAVREAIEKSYRFFNHTVAREPDGRALGASNFSHRTAGGFHREQYSGAKSIADDLAQVGLWASQRTPYTESQVASAVAAINNYTVTPLGTLTTPRYIYNTTPNDTATWPAEEPGSFIRDVNDGGELIAVKRPAYYTAIYVGKPAGSWYIRQREDFRPYDTAEHTAGAAPTYITPFLGGGLSLFATPDYGNALLATNWAPTTHHGPIATRSDGLRYWSDYHQTEYTVNHAAGTLTITGTIEALPIAYTRLYTFRNHKLDVHLTLTATAACSLARLVENIPILQGAYKLKGANLSAPSGQVAQLRDADGNGIDIRFDAPQTLTLVPNGLIYGTEQIGRIEVELPATLAQNQTVTLSYSLVPIPEHAPDEPALIAYEGFDGYAPGSIDGQGGEGQGEGFGGNVWTSSVHPGAVEAESLSYGPLVTAGGALRFSQSANQWNRRILAEPITPQNGEQYWISYLVSYPVITSGDTWAGARWRSESGARGYWSGKAYNLPAHWALDRPAADSGIPIATDQTHLVIQLIEFADGTARKWLWVNPGFNTLGGADLDKNAAIVQGALHHSGNSPAIDPFVMLNLECHSRNSAIFDEIRLGRTYAAVTPVADGWRAPSASDAAIGGHPRVGQTLTGLYTYDGGFEEGNSLYRWLTAEAPDGEYTAIHEATAATYTPTAADRDRHIVFEVTPVDTAGAADAPIRSAPAGPVYVVGDFNGDGTLSGLDIPGFKQALADPNGWAMANPARPHPNDLGDFNGDGVFSGLDIPGFKQALAGQ